MKLYIYNSKTNEKEEFIPINKDLVRMYVCGPTVYNEIHVGNARSAIVFDILFRVLKLIFPNVVYTRNLTDIDDKIINRAHEEGKTCLEVSEFWADSYHDNCDKLKLLNPTYEPKATETIDEIIEFVSNLIENNFAYEKDGTVFFDVEALDEYGCVSNNKEVMKNKRIAENEGKSDQRDFVLWKPSTEVYEPYWNSPWGKGRPGWHIECSAMSHKFLGETFDIHAGGSDLLFPHHENEHAQNVGCYGKGAGPKYWMHNAMLLLGGDKMSKSIGNILLLSDILKKMHPVFFKFYILNTHYRHMLSWDEDAIVALANKFDNWILHIGLYFSNADIKFEEADIADLLNDLNTPGFFAKIDARLSKAISFNDEKEFAKLAGLLYLLGLDVDIEKPSLKVAQLANERLNYKKNLEFDLADKLRDDIEQLGFVVMDTVDGYVLKPKFSSLYD